MENNFRLKIRQPIFIKKLKLPEEVGRQSSEHSSSAECQQPQEALLDLPNPQNEDNIPPTANKTLRWLKALSRESRQYFFPFFSALQML